MPDAFPPNQDPGAVKRAILAELLRDRAAATRFAASAGEFLLALSRARAKAPKLSARCEEALDMCFAYAEFVTKNIQEARAASAEGKEGGR